MKIGRAGCPLPRLRTESYYIAWAGLEFPGSSDLPASASVIAGTIAMHHYIQLVLFLVSFMYLCMYACIFGSGNWNQSLTYARQIVFYHWARSLGSLKRGLRGKINEVSLGYEKFEVHKNIHEVSSRHLFIFLYFQDTCIHECIVYVCVYMYAHSSPFPPLPLSSVS